MSEHHAGVRWTRSTPDFTYNTYDRTHTVVFKNGAVTLTGSAGSAYFGNEAQVNPEEAFVAALSACHMLTFLAVCTKKKLVVDAYEDEAVGLLEKNTVGKMAITKATLNPRVRFSTAVDDKTLAELHHAAHLGCFIANSVKTDVTVTPRS